MGINYALYRQYKNFDYIMLLGANATVNRVIIAVKQHECHNKNQCLIFKYSIDIYSELIKRFIKWRLAFIHSRKTYIYIIKLNKD